MVVSNCCYASCLVIAEGTGVLKLLAKQLITAAADTQGAEQKRTERHPDGLWTWTTQCALRDWIDLPSMISVNTAQHTGGATARGDINTDTKTRDKIYTPSPEVLARNISQFLQRLIN